MTRPLGIEFRGAVYRLTTRGDRREDSFVDDPGRQALSGVPAQAPSRFDVQALAYCLMVKHCHFVLHTRQTNRSLPMRYLIGVYTQTSNRQLHL